MVLGAQLNRASVGKKRLHGDFKNIYKDRQLQEQLEL